MSIENCDFENIDIQLNNDVIRLIFQLHDKWVSKALFIPSTIKHEVSNMRLVSKDVKDIVDGTFQRIVNFNMRKHNIQETLVKLKNHSLRTSLRNLNHLSMSLCIIPISPISSEIFQIFDDNISQISLPWSMMARLSGKRKSRGYVTPIVRAQNHLYLQCLIENGYTMAANKIYISMSKTSNHSSNNPSSNSPNPSPYPSNTFIASMNTLRVSLGSIYSWTGRKTHNNAALIELRVELSDSRESMTMSILFPRSTDIESYNPTTNASTILAFLSMVVSKSDIH